MEFSIPEITPPEFIGNISHIGSFIIFHTPILYAVLAIFFIFYFIVSVILIYHWNAYGMKAQGVIVAETLYVFISIILFLIAILSLLYF